ncbi:MAG: GAF domain-containing protein [Deltaproteobacteria bacterium]|nr:GAF domain-containing protein [Deltaproteobacteria bacterium]
MGRHKPTAAHAPTARHLRDVDAVAEMSRAELEAHAKALRAVNAVTDALLLATDVHDVFRRTLDAVGAFTHFPGVAIFALDSGGQTLELMGARGFGDDVLRAAQTLPVEGSLTGLAVGRGELVTSEDVAHDARTAPKVRRLLGKEGFAGLASVPLSVAGRAIGALNLIYKGRMGLTLHERALINALAKVVALAVERARHLEQLEAEITERRREESWRSFLAESSVVLASSLDLEQTLARVVRLAVRTLATWSVVDLVEEGGELRRVAGAHRDPAKQPLVDALVLATKLDKDAPEGVALAVRSGQTLVRQLDESKLRPGGGLPVSTTDEVHLQRLRELGGRSYIIVPLVSSGRTLGTVSLIANEPGAFGLRDVARAEELARRCASAIDNAAHYRKAQEAIAARDQFLSIASHELKTPLTSLHLTIEALGRRSQEDPAERARLGLAKQQVRRLTQLIESLLDASRIATGRFPLQPEDVELGELVSEVLARFRDEATRAGCALVLRRSAVVNGHWDRLRIDQVVSNLVSNAIKYGPGAPIECEVDRDAEQARLRVIDHGIGIAKADLSRIFGRFERAVSARQYGGLGLGLHIAGEIVRAHGGTLGAESSPGAGSTFTVTLPTSPPAPAASADPLAGRP